MKKKTSKRKNNRKLNPEERKKHAKKWPLENQQKDLISAYSKKYSVYHTTAHYELMELGYRDFIAIQYYEKEGIEWEYKVDGYTGEMLVVPKGTEDWELPLFY